MSAPTIEQVPDIELIEHLDFEPEVPCEANHVHQEPPPATLLVEAFHCEIEQHFICDECWDLFGEQPLTCRVCGARWLDRKDCMRIVRRLK